MPRTLSEFEVKSALEKGKLFDLLNEVQGENEDGPTAPAPEEAETEKALSVLRREFPH